MSRLYLLATILVLFSGCITDYKPGSGVQIQSYISSPFPNQNMNLTGAPNVPTEKVIPKLGENVDPRVPVEVNYTDYVNWFVNHNRFIRGYIPGEYVCGQYTVDKVNDSEKAGYKAYFAVISFTDGTGHALVSFRSTVSGNTSWYFIEPQNNRVMTPEALAQVVNGSIGKTVTEVNVYGYFDDAGDKDPMSWRFAYPLYNKKY